MNEWNIIAGLLCLVLLIFLIWKEWSRKKREYLIARLAATVVAVLCLYFLAVPPSYLKKIEQAGNSLILLTEGALNDSVRAVPGYDKMPVFDLRKTTIIDEIPKSHPGVNTIHVFGYGLESHQLGLLKDQSIIFHSTQAPDGFSRLQYEAELEQGERMVLEGQFNVKDTTSVRIVLAAFGVTLDSAGLDPAGKFHLEQIPAHVGRALYSLIALKGKDTLEKQPLPLQVNEQKKLRLLFLNSAPGFESRFLKAWLAEKGYPVSSRTRVSKMAYSKEFINEDGARIDVISAAVLDQTDCVIVDAGAWATLASGERAAIQKAMSEKGLGLLLCIDGGEAFAGSLFRFRLSQLPGGAQQKLDLKLTDGGKALKTLNTENQFEIVAADLSQSLVENRGGKLFSVAVSAGRGRVVLNAVNYTYKWRMQGFNYDYDLFWSTLLNKALGNRIEERWSLESPWVVVDQPLTITLETASESPVGQIAGQKVYLANDPRFPYRWQGHYWPRTAGWQSFLKTDGSMDWFYVYDKASWLPLRMDQRIEGTKDFVSSARPGSAAIVKQERIEKKQVPAIIYLLLFMLAAGFLWYEDKRMSG